MNSKEDIIVNSPEGRSALEKHIFGITDDMEIERKSSEGGLLPDKLGDEDLSFEDVPPPPSKMKTTSDLFRMAIEAHEAGNYADAELLYRKLLSERPNVPSAWGNLGVLLRRRKMTEAAVICLRRGLALRPDDGTSWSNLGNALRDLCRYDEAVKAHRHAIDLDPGAPQIHYNLGLVHRDLGHLKEAEGCFRRAELLGYDSAELRWDHALLDLLKGDLEQGFEGLEARWQLHDCHPHFPEIPIWKGAPLEGQTLMVYAENGIGDSLQFCRYLPLVQSKAGAIVFYCDPSIKRLIQSSPEFEGVEVYGFDDALPEDIDAVIPLMSLPRMVGAKSEDIPNRIPYLKAPDTDVPILNKGLIPQIRVGLVWAGDIHHKNDHNRSIALEQFAQLLDLPGIQFYSFQIGGAESQIKDHCFDPMIRDLSAHIRDFADTASLLNQFDLVISVDTAVAHLAGALDIPVWVLIPFAPDWRWQMLRGDSPWYRSMSLLRQTSPGDWQEVMHRVRDRLIHKLHEITDIGED